MDDRPALPWLKMEVSLGTLLTALSMLVVAVAFMFRASGTADQATTDLARYQTESKQTLESFRQEVRLQFADVTHKIENLPSQAERINQLDKAVQDGRADVAALRAQLDATRQMAIESRAQLENISRASGVPLRQTR